ncbi:hypothetical protein POP72_001 [Pectobacterium phage POP72]|uniref:Uncharacterized protein n=2 Tax=Axomammavirus PP1 TaxID=2733578 RepID=I7FWI3_9CAUD|nr:hypothetical protein F486_gp01 [Pectobacterium phage PP1]AFP33664.1 hypothetical protein PP1_001 [Pectobacterium phage PP1]ARB10917.1 hypothetical protein POP72_001 [Pectobacterium phage POP72]
MKTITILFSRAYEEYKVIFEDGTYYTSDKDDAVATATQETGGCTIKHKKASETQENDW